MQTLKNRGEQILAKPGGPIKYLLHELRAKCHKNITIELDLYGSSRSKGPNKAI